MKNVFTNLWSVRSALKQSSTLIRLNSNLRIAAMGVADQGIGRTTKLAKNSDLCSGAGQGKQIFGLLIGAPISSTASS